MINPNYLLNAIDVVLDWDLPDAGFSQAVCEQARLMAGITADDSGTHRFR